MLVCHTSEQHLTNKTENKRDWWAEEIWENNEAVKSVRWVRYQLSMMEKRICGIGEFWSVESGVQKWRWNENWWWWRLKTNLLLWMGLKWMRLDFRRLAKWVRR